MKKTVSIMLCLLLIFSSVNFAFASATSWDTTDQANLQTIKNQLSNTSGGSIYYMISQINAAMRFSNKTIANWLSDIDAELSNTLWYVDGNTSRSITWWVKEAVLDLDQLVGTGSGSLLYYVQTINTNVNTILTRTNSILTNMGNIDANIAFIQGDTGNLVTDMTTLLGYALGIQGYEQNIDTTTTTYLPYISDLRIALTNEPYYNITSGLSVGWSKHFAHRSLFRSLYDSSTFVLENGYYNLPTLTSSGNKTDQVFAWNFGTPLGNLALMLQQFVYNEAMEYKYRWSADLTGYNSTQTAKNWLTLQNKTFTPNSQTNGLYTWLANIQEPIARLSYVHASDEEIAAREKAEANQTAVVNNFIDSSGSGAAPASSFGDIASMSAGYTSNMDTDASPSGIWNIFNSNNFGWFSQETVNQLDTTVSTRKGSSDFNTPLLDQQIADIYKELGVDVND